MDELNDEVVKKDGEDEDFDPAATPEDEDELADEVVDDTDESSL